MIDTKPQNPVNLLQLIKEIHYLWQKESNEFMCRMNRTLTLYFILISLFAVNTSLLAVETEPINFSRITINEGLSQSTVFSIAQDKQGNMWFATYDGVNKYDGYMFTVYRNESDNPNSIANEIARIIKKDSKDRIWIGTREGLSFYDDEKDKFSNFSYEINGNKLQVNAIEEIGKDLLFIGTDKGILCFDTKDMKFVDMPVNNELKTLIAVCMLKVNDLLYIGTENGLYQYHLNDNKLTFVSDELKRKRIQAVLFQSESRLWIGTEGGGLYLFNPKTNTIKNYQHDPNNPKSISSNYIRSLALDAQNKLWVGTFNNLNIYWESTDSFYKYSYDPMDNRSLSQNSIRSLFLDSQGGMWLGTYFGGLNYYHPLKNRFKHLKQIHYHNSLNDIVVSCIVEDKDKNIWIGTNDRGLNLYNPNTKVFTHYMLQEGSPSSIASNNIKAVYIDEKNDLVYIGTHTGGLSVLHRKSKQVNHYTPKSCNLTDENVYAILPGDNNTLLLGTLNGLVLFDPQKKEFHPIPTDNQGNKIKNNRITVLFKDSQKRLWIGGENGLSTYKTNGTVLEKQNIIDNDSILSTAFVNCIMEKRPGEYWVGTRHGLYQVNETKKEIKNFTTKDGLPNNVIYGILEDSFGRLWMSTNKGLACYSPSTGNFRNFTETDGLQSNQFNNYSYCKTSNGDMMFGGINGITIFRPELLMDNPYTPPVVITDLKLFNKSVHPDDETGILDKEISITPSITLKASQSAFSLEFVVSNYISGQHNTFAYKLEGYDKEWYYVTDQRTVSYSNLPHGTYIFKVKAANSDGKWNDTTTELEVVILPVWYKTWWAILLFIVAGAGLVIFIFRYFWMQKSMEAEIKMERMEKDKQEEINQMKMRFFINISHELRTPLTLILAPLQELLYRVSDKWTRGQLQHIQRNANRLLHLVNQLMDYRRAELGVFELKVAKGNINKLIDENFMFYDKLARRKNIDYSFNSEIGEKEFLFDANYLELIVNNLLSNAFKFTDEGGSITVGLKEEDNNLVITISDTGIGIPKEKQGKIFERFYQVNSDHSGSGIGLSLILRLIELHHGKITLDSEVNKGSTFKVYIPQDESLYKPEEIKTAEEENEKEVAQHSINTKETFYLETEMAQEIQEEGNEKKKGKILIVEDNQEISQYLSDGLASLYTVIRAENGEEGLEALKNNEDIDVIITDVMMPVMDGIKMCKQIKQNIRTCHIPVIILSAKIDIKDQLEGLQVGADDYIPKPFALSVLTAKIQNMIRTRRRIFEHYSKNLEVEPEKITFNAMDEELLKRAVAIVEKNMDNIEFSTDEFAREMNMSRSNLHLKLKAITGESTIDFIRKIRFNEACKLLKDGRYTVSEVSTMVGFNTPSYFATSFKKYFGCLPTEYIKSRRG